jgi:hypothetical protein
MFEFADSLYWALTQAEAISLETDITQMMGSIDVITSPAFQLPKGMNWLIPSEKKQSLTTTRYGDDNGRPQFIDMYLKEVGDACGKSFFPLEKIEDQMRVGQNAELNYEKAALVPKFTIEDMKTAYLVGNIEYLHDMVKQSTSIYDNLYEELITKRNLVMANGLDTLIRQHVVFCGVGAAHLGGKEGIIPLLRERGFQLRPIKASFTDQKKVFLSTLKACSDYQYVNERYGFGIPLGGKPNIIEDHEKTVIDYQELGQGNSYSIYVAHNEILMNNERIARSYFDDVDGTISSLDSLKLKDGTLAFRAKIESSEETYWIQSFSRNDILYLLYASGGYRFLNSNRPFEFFDRFFFLPEQESPVLNQRYVSPMETLSLYLPDHTYEHQEETETEASWRVKYFNPSNGEAIYVFENLLIDNTIYVGNQFFGENLLSEFHEDSIHYSAVQEHDAYIEKSFNATKNGKSAAGIVRQMGNILQFIQYTGEDEEFKQSLFSGFETHSIQRSLPEVRISKTDFQAIVSKAGFELLSNENERGYRESKTYVSHDIKNAISYEVVVKKYQPWVFSEISDQQLLENQITFPDTTNTNYSVDTTYVFYDSTKQLHFTLSYPDAKNTWKGITSIHGKNIITYSMNYPSAANDYYSNYVFLDSFQVNIYDTSSFSTYSVEDLNRALTEEREAALHLLEDHFLSSKTAKKLLLELDQTVLDNRIFKLESVSSPRALLLKKLTKEEWNDSLYLYWKEHAITAENEFTEVFLEKSLRYEADSLFLNAFREAQQLGISISNGLTIAQFASEKPALLRKIWNPIARQLMKEEPTGLFFEVLEKVNSDPFFLTFIQSEEFRAYALEEFHPNWCPLYYFYLLERLPNSTELVQSRLQNWDVEKDNERAGIKAGFTHFYQGKLTRDKKKQLKKDIFFQIGYAKAISVLPSTEKYYLERAEALGLIAFDYYEDRLLDKSKTFTYLGKSSVKSAHETKVFYVYKGVEHEKTYHFIKEIPNNDVIHIKDFGKNIQFIDCKEDARFSEIEKAISKVIN